ncbi:MAG: hypothetical protein CMM48_17610 [Rhodospirillaceae bacterium]|nr:hypothetical protein [Rhodospirillaceae bacterium]HAA91463.1 hypothetical protein [Rhodospirillaceae bacterium]|tara:strand:+ start:170 stop:1084 length:915 start_codon:yes stop_codon:yes gene_type:complete
MANMEAIIAKGKRGQFFINPHDTVISRSLQIYGEFAEHKMMLLSHWLQPGQTVFDVGANIGTHAVFFSQKVGSSGKVIALEPQPEIFTLLQKNLDLNACQNVKTINAACAANKGEVEFPALDYNRDANFGGFTLLLDDVARFFPVNNDGSKIRVPVITLDDLTDHGEMTNCDLVKIDAEGMETDIISGTKRTLEKYLPILYVENNNQRRSPQLIEAVLSLGYKAYWHVISYFRPENFAKATENIFAAPLELNLLCVPKGSDASKCDDMGLPLVKGPNQWLPEEIGQGLHSANALIDIAESFGDE